MKIPGAIILLTLLFSCDNGEKNWQSLNTKRPSEATAAISVEPLDAHGKPPYTIETGNTTPEELIGFAQTLKGTPYKYGSTDPAQGFDCSGFVTYVFNHFKISVPRSSVDFSYAKRDIDSADARPGDLILFTGTDSTVRTVGHMGIIVSHTNKRLAFIHATSGKTYGVTETPLNIDYQRRYMKTIRVFPQNDR